MKLRICCTGDNQARRTSVAAKGDELIKRQMEQNVRNSDQVDATHS